MKRIKVVLHNTVRQVATIGNHTQESTAQQSHGSDKGYIGPVLSITSMNGLNTAIVVQDLLASTVRSCLCGFIRWCLQALLVSSRGNPSEDHYALGDNLSVKDKQVSLTWYVTEDRWKRSPAWLALLGNHRNMICRIIPCKPPLIILDYGLPQSVYDWRRRVQSKISRPHCLVL